MEGLALALAAWAAAEAAGPALERRVTLAAVGDLQLAVNLRRPDLLPDGDPFALVRADLDADLTVGNLEGPVVPPGGLPDPRTRGPLLRQPDDVGTLLARAGFDLVSLANNHILDYGPQGALATLEAVRAAGVDGVGVWEDPSERFHPVVREVHGLTVGFLAYTHWLNLPQAWRDVGLGSFREDHPAADIAALRPYVDFVVVLAHWEWEDDPLTYGRFRDLARSLVDAGADVVVGHHPHVLKGLEWQEGALVAYSLGNFVFGLQERTPRATGAVLRFTLVRGPAGSRAVRDVRIVPVRLDGPNWIPRPLQGSEAAGVWAELRFLSGRLGADLDAAGLLRTPADAPLRPRWRGLLADRRPPPPPPAADLALHRTQP